jgi:hypothetical protein
VNDADLLGLRKVMLRRAAEFARLVAAEMCSAFMANFKARNGNRAHTIVTLVGAKRAAKILIASLQRLFHAHASEM